MAARGSLYREWIAANGLAEAAGLGTTFVLGRALAPILSAGSSALGIIAGALGAVAAGILLEGAVVGCCQGWVLRRHFPTIRFAAWVRATMIGAGVAWLIGMIPSTAIGLIQLAAAGGPAAPGGPPAQEPPKLLQYGLAVLLGAATGPILGAVQARALVRLRPPVKGWIVANAAAWALGMLVIFAGMDQLPWTRGGLPLMLGVYLVCGLAGLAVGAVHGRWLVPHVRSA